MVGQRLYEGAGFLAESSIRLWVRLTGKRVAKSTAAWLQCPVGPRGRIGDEIYTFIAQKENLQLRTLTDGGLLADFGILRGPDFDPAQVRPEIRDFYEHTSCYQLEAWSEAGLWSRFFLWMLMKLVSQRMDQLNFPVSSLELAGGMTSEVLELVDPVSERRVYTGWLRRLVTSGRVIYAGLYSAQQPPGHSGSCVKVCFPLPLGSAAIFLRPMAMPDGSFKLISAGSSFGDPGAYRMVEVDADHWNVRYIRTLQEVFHVYVDDHGILRTEHGIHFLGIAVLRLHYKIVRVQAGSRNRTVTLA